LNYPVIVVAAYSRSVALSRLLGSINRAIFPTADHRLIISIDGGGGESVVEVAKEFNFVSGTTEVVTRDCNIGLREHILWCGGLSEKYGSVIVLEDDLIVAPLFYHYASEADNYYSAFQEVAGIALYSPVYNEVNNLPFQPMQTNCCIFFMQVPCSSGQLWNYSQWRDFKEWYLNFGTNIDLNEIINLPDIAKKWPQSSWKKYFYAYIATTGKYIVYPYNSYTSNCSDPGGTHVSLGSNMFQVPLSSSSCLPNVMNFIAPNDMDVQYDSFSEPASPEMFRYLGLNVGDVEIDLHGAKPLSLLNSKNYVLTSRRQKTYVKKFFLAFKPIEKFYLAEAEECLGFSRDSIAIYLVKSTQLEYTKPPTYSLLRYYYCSPFATLPFLCGFALELTAKLLSRLKSVFSLVLRSGSKL